MPQFAKESTRFHLKIIIFQGRFHILSEFSMENPFKKGGIDVAIRSTEVVQTGTHAVGHLPRGRSIIIRQKDIAPVDGDQRSLQV